MSRAVSVTIALLFAVCGSARRLPTDESAPLVLVRIIPIPGVGVHNRAIIRSETCRLGARFWLRFKMRI